MNIDSQQEVWNKIADSWNKHREEPLDFVIDFLENRKGKVLDMGCGSGRHIIKSEKIKFYGVDFSKNMLKLAEKKSKNSIFFLSSLEKLPFKENFFDFAIYISALHCLTTKKQREKSLKELKRVLKPNKEALISVWNKNQKRFRNKTSKQLISWNNKKVQRYYYLYEGEELISLLKKIGFDIVSVNEDRNINVIVKKLV